MPHPVLSALAGAGVIATLRAPSREAALTAVDALVAEGITAIEVTYSTPGAAGVVRELADRYGDAVVLGAGTLTLPEQAVESAAAGAQFLVAPGHDPRVTAAILDTGALAVIGAFTPAEVMAVTSSGAHVVKLFPASLGGPGLLRALRGPFPDLQWIPTGGVRVDNIGEWFTAGAVAVGMGSELLPSLALAAQDHAELRAVARTVVAALAEARRPRDERAVSAAGPPGA